MTARDAAHIAVRPRVTPAAATVSEGRERARGDAVGVDDIAVQVLVVPTEEPESDGTFAWDETTAVIVEVQGGGQTGLGYTYASAAAAGVIHEHLADVVHGRDVMDVAAAWDAMRLAVRNVGLPGIAACAISAVDAALWDLKARVLEVPLGMLLGPRRDRVPIYGSGGFTSYHPDRLRDQLRGWVEQGIRGVKMKVGREPRRDPDRIAAARDAIGADAGLLIDANGAFTRRGAVTLADAVRDLGVSWFEEPVSGDDLAGLRWVRDRVPPHTAIAAGEYAWHEVAVRRHLESGSVDVMQADATRCCGITGFLLAASLCEAHQVPLSAHTAPALHLHVCHAAPRILHMEYFHDHVRVERELFDGVAEPADGALRFDAGRPGMGLELRHADVERYRRS